MTSFMESERLSFRAPDLEDLDTITHWINEAAIRRYLDSRVFPVSKSSEERWLERITKQTAEPPTDIVMLFHEKGSEELIGTSGLHSINWVVRSARWGIVIGPRFWSKAYGREVAHRFLQYAFEELGLNRVALEVAVTHQAAIKCYKAAGFVEEGVLRDGLFIQGEYVDMVAMSVLRREWLKASKAQEDQPEQSPPEKPAQ